MDAAPVGVFRMTDEKGEDEKILCVPLHDPHWSEVSSLDQVPDHLLQEIEHFFEVYKELERKETHTRGWGDREEAATVIEDARERYRR